MDLHPIFREQCIANLFWIQQAPKMHLVKKSGVMTLQQLSVPCCHLFTCSFLAWAVLIMTPKTCYDNQRDRTSACLHFFLSNLFRGRRTSYKWVLSVKLVYTFVLFSTKILILHPPLINEMNYPTFIGNRSFIGHQKLIWPSWWDEMMVTFTFLTFSTFYVGTLRPGNNSQKHSLPVLPSSVTASKDSRIYCNLR